MNLNLRNQQYCHSERVENPGGVRSYSNANSKLAGWLN